MCLGTSLYIAYNCRAAFLYGTIVIIVFLIYKMMKSRNLKQSTLVIIGFIIGLSIISYPQCIINKQYVGNYSPKVYTEQYTGYNSNLQATQVLWGITNPRYETYIGDAEQYSSPAVYFDDPIGNRIISMEGITAENFSFTDIIRIFLKYPLDTIGIYTRHLVSLVTPVWNQLYITNIYTNKFLTILISIAIWLVSGLNIMIKFNSKEYNIENLWYYIAICTPAVLQLFGAPELRFFLPVYVLLYTYFCLGTDWNRIIGFIKPRWQSVTIVILLITILWITVLGDILSFNRELPLLINDNMSMIVK